ncbi:DUF721 domain-containing protein, partial [Streptomyces bambusae]|nr:DUF721 domain-containing protein [Streptomyces bambusae]
MNGDAVNSGGRGRNGGQGRSGAPVGGSGRPQGEPAPQPPSGVDLARQALA